MNSRIRYTFSCKDILYAKKAKEPETLPGHGAFAFDVCIIYHCVIPVKYMLVIKP